MEKLSVIVRNYETKDGRTFTKISVGGKFLPDVLAEDEVSYRVSFNKKSPAEEPKNDGIYEVAYNEGDLWIDTRPEFIEKHIVRIVAQKVRFSKPLPKLDKDVRVK